MKIKSRDDLKVLREKYRSTVLMRLMTDYADERTEVRVGMADCGIAAGARETLKVFFDECNAADLEDVAVIAVDCMANSDEECGVEPIVEVCFPNKPPVRYKNVDSAVAKEIVAKHLVGGTIVDHAKMEV